MFSRAFATGVIEPAGAGSPGFVASPVMFAGQFMLHHEVAFNAGDDHFLGACTDSNAAQDNLDISDADPVKLDQALNTHTAGAHSVAADPVTVADFVPAAAGLCGANPCVLIYTSSGHDDPSEWQQEASEDRSRDDRSRDDDSRDDDSRDDRR